MADEHSDQSRGDLPADLSGAIARAKSELEQMVDLNPQVMLLVDNQGRIVRANRAVLDLSGAESFSALLGQAMEDVFRTGEAGFFSELLASRTGMESSDAHVSLPNGFVRELSFTLVGSGARSGVNAVIVSDITGNKEQSADEERQHKQAAVKALLGGLMHNLNQPLTVIMVSAKLIQMALEKPDPDREEIKAHLATVTDMAMQFKGMLEKLEKSREYVTEAYVDGSEILDLKRIDDAAS